MEDKFERYCCLGMILSTILLIALLLGALFSALGFAVFQHLGFYGCLLDLVVFAVGVAGFASTIYFMLCIKTRFDKLDNLF